MAQLQIYKINIKSCCGKYRLRFITLDLDIWNLVRFKDSMEKSDCFQVVAINKMLT